MNGRDNDDLLNWLAVGISAVCASFMMYLIFIVVSGKETLW